jgi:sigma-E factor negative regulatory protein RseC
MIEEQARVIEIREDRALVATERSSSCENCSARSGCATLGGGREARVWVIDGVGVQRGDNVIVAVPESTLLLASVITYLFPVVALILAAMAGQKLAPRFGWTPDLAAAGFGCAALVVALLLARFIAAKRIKTPRIIRKVK